MHRVLFYLRTLSQLNSRLYAGKIYATVELHLKAFADAIVRETNNFTAGIINDIANSKIFRSRSKANTTVKLKETT